MEFPYLFRLITNNASNNNTINSSIIIDIDCTISQDFHSFDEFFKCYKYFFLQKTTIAILEIALIFFTSLFNALVIVLIITRPVQSAPNTIFDHVLIGHAIVDGLTGLLDIPNFHIANLFGYWPMGNTYGLIWTSFDSGLVTITCVHMLYMSWVRFRSLKAPFSYTQEFLIKHDRLIILLIWIMGFSIWATVTFSFGLLDFTTIINYNQAIVSFFVWFIPLALIVVISFYIICILKTRKRRKSRLRSINKTPKSAIETSLSPPTFYQQQPSTSVSTNTKVVRNCLANLDAQAKFLIIIGTFLVQWLPSSILAMVVPICGNCVSNEVVSAVYWLTYTVCCTDAIVVLLLNSNVVFCRGRITP